jgi:hypothetical protein
MKNTIMQDQKRYYIAKLILQAPEDRISILRELYSDYFSGASPGGSLEHTSDLNTSFTKWIEDYGINREWIGDFPTMDIYNNYVRYCIANRLESMDKSLFYKALQYNFNISA